MSKLFVSQMKLADREIEVRFLEIDPKKLISKLRKLKALDLGKDLLQELIFYDQELNWQYKEKKQVRIRKTNKGTFMAFKHITKDTAEGTIELEFKIEDAKKASKFLQAIGLRLFRTQERIRYKFRHKDVIIDIDYYPKVPPLVELEGQSEEKLKEMAKLLDLNWKDVVFESSRFIIEKRYGIPVPKLKIYTFKKIA